MPKGSIPALRLFPLEVGLCEYVEALVALQLLEYPLCYHFSRILEQRHPCSYVFEALELLFGPGLEYCLEMLLAYAWKKYKKQSGKAK